MPDIDTSRDPLLDQHTDQQTDQQTVAPRRRIVSWRSITVTLILFAIVLMAVLPPLLNVNRFKRRIVTSISTSIGRPVHLDNVSLILLPLPAFKLENFVVAEDPAFGSEPVIHANNVVATLRVSSLWRRKVEFSRISLQEPSINLVYNPQGAWNVESILLQAARIPAAPTAQEKAGADPRFPYIEATGARVNLKSGIEKLPFSLTEADFALWLPEPQQWRIRVEARPTRTDTSASDTGTVSLEGTLGRAERFDLIPLDLSAEWKKAPLGETSRILTGRDAGLRGDLRLNIAAHGTIGTSTVKAVLDLRDARRAEFVPDRLLDLHAECQGTADETFHAFHEVRCTWPPLAVTADIPDIHQLSAASLEVGTPSLPAATLLDWLRIASDRVPPDVQATGSLMGKLSREPGVAGEPAWNSQIALKEFALSANAIGKQPIAFGIILVNAGSPPDSIIPAVQRDTKHRNKSVASAPPNGEFALAPTTLNLGAKDPAQIEGRFDHHGYTLHLTGSALPSRLLALGAALPQLGDGLADALPPPPKDTPARAELPIRLDLTSTRQWFGPQTWSKTTVQPSAKPAHRHH